MARSNRQDLFLSIRGDVTDLRTATAAGKTVLNEFGGTAINVLEQVEKKFGEIGSAAVPDIRRTEQAYVESFKRIRDAAAAASSTDATSAISILDANSARQAAEAATMRAAALREVAEAASRADVAEGGASAETRAYAVAASTAAIEAERMAQELRDQASILSGIERQLGTTGAAQRRAIVISGEQRAGYQQLSYQLGDISTQYALGASASQIFAAQSAQVIQALQLIGGEGNKVLQFLSGRWGLAITSAVVALSPFVGKLLEGNDALQKGVDALKKDAAEATVSARAKEIFAKSVDGVTAALNDQQKALDQSAESERSAAERANIAARVKFAEAVSIREATKARLEDAIAAKQALDDSNFANTDPRAAAAARRVRDENVKGLQALLGRANEQAERAERQYQESRVELAEEAAKRIADPISQINRSYDEQARRAEAAARKSARAGDEVTAALTQQLAAIEKNREADLKAQRERESASRSSSRANRQFGREVTVADATRIVGTIGGRVTSGVRSTERQAQIYADAQAGRHRGPVARPGTSAHEPGGAYDAIDVAYGPGISVKSIREAFAQEGVRLRKILNEPSQRVFHVEFARAGAGNDRAAARAQNEAEAAERKRVNDADAYQQLLDGVQHRQLDIARSRVVTIEEAADLDVQQVELARRDVEQAAQKGVALGRWTQAQADAVKMVALENSINEQLAIRRREDLALINRRFEIDQSALADRVGLLRLDGELAKTAEERRAIARQLLELEQKQVEAALRNRIANENDPERRAGLQRQLDGLGGEYARRRAILDQEQGDPLQRYGRDLIETTADMNEALKGVAADGFRALEDAGSREIANVLKLKGAYGDLVNSVIADLARLAIRKALISTLGTGFFGLADGGAVADLPGYANGGIPSVDNGLIRGPGTGRSDSILALVAGRKPIRVSNGEAIVNERGVRNHWPLIQAINEDRLPKFADGGLVGPMAANPRMPSLRAAEREIYGGRRDRVEVDARVRVDAGPEFDARVENVAARTIASAADPLMAEAENRTMSRLRRPDLPGGFG
ncbi:hypothetical protein [Sphingomonas sp. IW22]|uniref:hypothetical protein n=1 Tax=Sphingomonas sp. IW22 TaxID=3242489 RepID=UPI0035209D6A